jgi:hypothetical protein
MIFTGQGATGNFWTFCFDSICQASFHKLNCVGFRLMLLATIVTTAEELKQIQKINGENLKSNLSKSEVDQEGFVSWLYPLQLLQQMHRLAPSIIIKDDETVVAYALTTLKESVAFHADLKKFIDNIEGIWYKNKKLQDYNYYCMGQICVSKSYRGKNFVQMLYQKHKEVYSRSFELLITEISASNIRSQKAHERVGFKTIYTYTDSLDEWNVVVWDWN